jgi:hypothetical protein
MELSQGNSLYSYLKQTKMENRRAEQVLFGVLVPVGGGRMWGESTGR